MNIRGTLFIACALAAAAGHAAAQSSVTLFGRVDADLQKRVGTNARTMGQGNNSVWGIRSVEDLGGGLKAYADLFSDIFPQTGTTNTNPGFWGSKSVVGLRNDWGYVEMGRKLTPAWVVAINGDPFGTYGYTTINNSFLHADHLFTSARMSNSVTVAYDRDGWFAQALIADGKPANYWSTPPNIQGASTTVPAAGFGVIANTGSRPVSLAAGYNKGKVYAGIGYEQTGYNTKALFGTVNYNFDVIKLIASAESGYHYTGTGAKDVKATNVLLGFSAPLFGGTLLGSYDVLRTKVQDATGSYVTFNPDNVKVYSNSNQLGLGFQYPLSKRTFLYTDFAHNQKSLTINGVAQSKNGYDFGISHSF